MTVEPVEQRASRGGRLVRSAILFAGLGGLTFVVIETVDDANTRALPTPTASVASTLLTVLALVLAGRAWTALFSDVLRDRASRRRVALSVYVSQLAKYLPAGGLMQAASQVGLSAAGEVPLSRVAVAFPVFALSLVVAGCTVGGGLVFATGLPATVRLMALAGLAAPVLLHRSLASIVLSVAHRVVRRVPAPANLPGQRAILVCYGWAVGNILCYSLAFAVVLHSLDGVGSPTMTASGFALSWVAGFVVVPIPSGLGIREAVLVATGQSASGAVLAASLAHRVLTVIAEVAIVGGSMLTLRIAERRLSQSKRRPTTETDPR